MQACISRRLSVLQRRYSGNAQGVFVTSMLFGESMIIVLHKMNLSGLQGFVHDLWILRQNVGLRSQLVIASLRIIVYAI